jgi:hypothetical protein
MIAHVKCAKQELNMRDRRVMGKAQNPLIQGDKAIRRGPQRRQVQQCVCV